MILIFVVVDLSQPLAPLCFGIIMHNYTWNKCTYAYAVNIIQDGDLLGLKYEASAKMSSISLSLCSKCILCTHAHTHIRPPLAEVNMM